MAFSRTSGTVVPDFVPAKGYKMHPVGDARKAQRDASRAVKAKTKWQKKEEAGGLVPFIEKMDSLTPTDAIHFLSDDDLPTSHFRRYVEAEKASKNRKQVLAYFGQSPAQDVRPDADAPATPKA